MAQRRRGVLGTIIISIGGIILSPNLTASSPVKKTLRVVTVADHPPFSFMRTHKHESYIEGIDVVLVKQLAQNIGYRLNCQQSLFPDPIYPGAMREVDIIIGGIFPTASVKKWVAFSKPYYRIGPTLLHKDSKKLRRVGIMIGSHVEAYAKAWAKNNHLPVELYTHIRMLMAHLQQGVIEGAILEHTLALGLHTTLPARQFTLKRLKTSQNGYVVAFSRKAHAIEAFMQAFDKIDPENTTIQLIANWQDYF